MRATEAVTQWVTLGKIRDLSFIGKDVLIYCYGCYIKCKNVKTLETHYFAVNFHSVNGDGVKCLRGHRTLNVFAYVENCQNPNLYIMSYPFFQIISKFEHGLYEGYKTLTFSETSLVFTLGDKPNYVMSVWNWRSGEKFCETPNEVLVAHQMIRCSWGKPMYLAQMALDTTTLVIWDVFTVCRKTLFSKHYVNMGKDKPAQFSDMTWTTDGGFFLIDRKGEIYTLGRDFTLEKVVEWNEEGDVRPKLCWYKAGIVASGPTRLIRHYKKSGTWVCDWSYEVTMNLEEVICNRGEYFVGKTVNSEIVVLGSTLESLTYLNQGLSDFTDIGLIYPDGKYLVALCERTELNVYEVSTGNLVNTYIFREEALIVSENPEFPYIAIGKKMGLMRLLSLYDVNKITPMAKFHLTTNPITNIKFFEHGRMIVAGNASLGEFFIIEGLPGTQMQIITRIEVNYQVIDFFLVSSSNCYRMFVLPVTSKDFLAGNKFIRYCIISKDNVNVKEYYTENKQLYYRIHPATGQYRDRVFYALPLTARRIHMIETKRGDDVARLSSEIVTGHALRQFHFRHTKYHAITFGYDGFVIVRDSNFEKVVAMTCAHHRYHGGVKKAYIEPLEQYVISLGHDNVLVCMKLPYNSENSERSQRIQEFKQSSKYALMFKRPTIGFDPEGRFKDKTWSEMEQILKFEKEQEICRIERHSILKEFHSVQTSLQQLVTQNIEGPQNENIDLIEFYLDQNKYHAMQQRNKEDCKQTDIYLRALIAAQDKVSDYMIKTYWLTMGVIWKVIYGFFANFQATNYCLLPENMEKLQTLAWIEEQRKVEQFLSSHDTFEPWVLIPKDKLLALVKKQPRLPREDYSGMATQRRLKQLEEAETEKTQETRVALAGSVSMLYIDVSPGHYQQRQLVTFYQCELQQAVAEREVIKLKQNYNRCFENSMAIKEREMYNIKEKNGRLRHIISEYNYFSDKKVSISIVDPEWDQGENPITVTRVTDKEICSRPYVSPSEQALLDAKEAEEERLRLLLLADDFRERALMKMMNGVLEVRWEDELKKDVPKPKCMVEKDPSQFNEDDLRAIRDYEEKCVQLQVEREKYKSLLEVEFTKISVNLRESIRKFNQKLWDCTTFKYYIDSGMNQENLQVNRARVNQCMRIDCDIREKNIISSIKSQEKDIEVINEQLISINEALNECRVNLDAMQAREKLLEKAFRRDIQEMSPVVQEVAVKLYKKRPKVGYKNIQGATILYELSKGIISSERTIAMTQECFDYLKSLEQLDMFVGLPPTIDENVYSLICKHRRLRIEYEIKLKAAQIQIAEGETTIHTFQKRLQTKKENIAKSNAELLETRDYRLYLMHNKQVQIVLRRGLVESVLTGSLDDFKDCILIPKSEIEYINRLIVEAGQRKVKSIMTNMAFRRKVMATEWEHKRLRMLINDLLEQKRDIEVVKFTKDMQNYLKNKALGRKPETESFEMEIELLSSAYENRIGEKKEKYAKIRRQIKEYKESNAALDKAIKDVNIDVCHFKLQKDLELESKEKDVMQQRIDAMLRRNTLVNQIQQNHNEILVLQTELELLRLRTYPTFKYQLINN